jgi:hypothetical protein
MKENEVSRGQIGGLFVFFRCFLFIIREGMILYMDVYFLSPQATPETWQRAILCTELAGHSMRAFGKRVCRSCVACGVDSTGREGCHTI